MSSEEVFHAQDHLCSSAVSVVHCFVSVLMATVPLSPFRRLAFFFFFNASNSLLRLHKKKKKKSEIYIYISPVMIDKLPPRLCFLFVWLFVLFCFLPLSPQSEQTQLVGTVMCGVLKPGVFFHLQTDSSPSGWVGELSWLVSQEARVCYRWWGRESAQSHLVAMPTLWCRRTSSVPQFPRGILVSQLIY